MDSKNLKGFKALIVWQKAIEFAVDVINIVENNFSPRKHYRLMEQMESSSTSVAMNIAEGKGRNSKKEYIQYLYIARGSLNETITLLYIFERLNWITTDNLNILENSADQIGKMLNQMIVSLQKT